MGGGCCATPGQCGMGNHGGVALLNKVECDIWILLICEPTQGTNWGGGC